MRSGKSAGESSKSAKADVRRPNTRQLKQTQLKLAGMTTTQPQPAQEMDGATANVANVSADSVVLTEIRKLRQENSEFHADTKTSLNRLEASMTEVKQRMDMLDERVTTAEQRVSDAEDASMLHQRALSYLLQREAFLAAKCDQMENQQRRDSIRLYGIPEGAESNNMSTFIKEFLMANVELEEELDVRIVRAHRSLGPKPTDPSAPPRSIIVKFLDHGVKETILHQAWKQGNIQHDGNKVIFDHDYSQSLQKKRKAVWEVIKKLREKNIKARTIYPAQIKISLDSGDKTFPSLLDAQATLKDLGVDVAVDERDQVERELIPAGWTTQRGKRKDKKRKSNRLKLDDVKSILHKEN